MKTVGIKQIKNYMLLQLQIVNIVNTDGKGELYFDLESSFFLSLYLSLSHKSDYWSDI